MQFVWPFRSRVGFYYFIVAVEKQKWHCIRMKSGAKVNLNETRETRMGRDNKVSRHHPTT